jgi:hypothetical protein
LKFVFDAADAVTTQLPEAVNVTTPDEIPHGPDTANDADTPDDKPVTFDTADAAGVYVSPDTGDPGTDDVNATV